jgi:anti-sigma-K factor RskA
MAAAQPDEIERVSGKMSGADDETMPEGGDDLLAAEYVLGVLDASARANAAARIDNERAFAARVDNWYQRLAPLDDSYATVTPPPMIKAAVDKRLFVSTQTKSPGLLESLAFWRGLSVAALALAAFVVVPAVVRRDRQVAKVIPIVAPMQADTGEVRFVALYEPGSDEIRITRVKADKAGDKDFELWFVDGSSVPESMGVLSNADTMSIKVKPEMIARINAGDAFAVSVEPLGGSPTGTATGPVIAVGVSKAI